MTSKYMANGFCYWLLVHPILARICPPRYGAARLGKQYPQPAYWLEREGGYFSAGGYRLPDHPRSGDGRRSADWHLPRSVTPETLLLSTYEGVVGPRARYPPPRMKQVRRWTPKCLLSIGGDPFGDNARSRSYPILSTN